jgi:HK97 gp10 family phage protein
MEVTMQVKGFAKLEQNLRALPDEIARKAMKTALKDGAEVIRHDIAVLAPRRTGFLATHIAVSLSSTKFGEVIAKIGPTKDAFYARFAEFGTKFERARPFMRPAFDTGYRVALERVRLRLADEIKKYRKP